MSSYHKKIVALGLALLLIASNIGLSTPQALAYNNFPDVATDAWYHGTVQAGVQKGYIQGYPDGRFRPSRNVTRAEFVKMMVKAHNLPFYGCDTTLYNDLKEEWYCRYVTSAAYLGIVNGYQHQNGTFTKSFGPHNQVSRAEGAAIIARLLDLGSKPSQVAPFIDVDQSQWYATAINQVYTAGIMKGYGNVFRPKSALNRAETADIIENSITPGTTPPPTPPDTVTPVANAGTDSTVTVGTLVNLSGTGSSDPNNDPLTYTWRIISKPTTSNSSLADFTTISPRITPDQPGTYTIGLIVSDGAHFSIEDQVVITAQTAPVPPPPPPPPAGNQLVINNAADLYGSRVPRGAIAVPFLNLKVKANSTQDITVDEVVFRRIGVGSRSDISNVYLYKNGDRFTSGRSINSEHQVEFTNIRLTIPAGQEIALSVKADISTSAIAGDQHSFQITSMSSISSNASSVQINTPITGPYIEIAGVMAGIVEINRNGTISNPSAGTKNVKVAQFQLNVSNESAELKSLSLKLDGSIDNSEISNFKLIQGTNTLAQTTLANERDLIVFKLNPTYRLEEGSSRIFQVNADISSGAEAGDSIRIYLEEQTDLEAIGQNSSVNVQANNNNYNSNNPSSSSVEVSDVIITQTRLSETKLALSASDTPLIKLNISAGSSNVDIQKLTFRIYAATETNFGTNSEGGLVNNSSSQSNFSDLRIINADTGRTLLGPKEISSVTVVNPAPSPYTAAEYAELEFRGNVSMDAGESLNMTLTTDVSSSAQAGNTIWAELRPVGSDSIKNVDNGQFITDIIPASSITGDKLTVESSSLTVSLASTPTSQSVVKGTTNLPLVAFIFRAGSSSAATVTSITLTGHLDENGDNTYDGDQIAGKDNSRQIREAVTFINLYDETGNRVNSSPADFGTNGKAVFDGLNWNVPAGTNLKLTVRGDISRNAFMNNNPDRIAVDIENSATDVTALNKFSNQIISSGTRPNNGATPIVKVTIANSGSLTASYPGIQVSSNILTANTTSATTARFRFFASNENFRVEQLTLKNIGNNHAAIGQVILYYPTDPANPTNLNGQSVAQVGQANGSIEFQNLNLAVPKNDYSEFEVRIDVTPINNNEGPSHTGDIIRINFPDDPSALFKAIGDSGETITSVSSLGLPTGGATANQHVIRKSIPSFGIMTINNNNSIIYGADADIFRFSVAASSKGEVALRKLTFEITQSGLKTGDDGINKANSVKLYNEAVDSNTPIATGTLSGSQISFVFAEQTIGRGSTINFKLRANILDDGTNNTNTLSTKIVEDTSANADVVNGDNTGTFAEVNANANVIIWTDKAITPHSDTTVDWTNSFRLGLPNTPYTLR